MTDEDLPKALGIEACEEAPSDPHHCLTHHSSGPPPCDFARGQIDGARKAIELAKNGIYKQIMMFAKGADNDI